MTQNSIRRFDQRSGRVAVLGAVALIALAGGCGKPPTANSTAASTAAERSIATGKPSEVIADKPRKKARLPHQLPRPEKPREARGDDWFEDVAAKWRIDFAYRDGSEAGFYQLLESVGGGGAMFDYDRDGDMDLFLTGGGSIEGQPLVAKSHLCALFRNDRAAGFANVAAESGLADPGFYSHGCTVGDYDRDGDPDLLVAGFGGCRLWRNDGTGRFADATADAAIVSNRWCVTPAFVDIDRDGWLDVFVVTYADWKLDARQTCANDRGLQDVCGPTLFPGDHDHLFRNRGDGRFEEITDAAGIRETDRGLGIVTCDFDEDGWQDIYVVNDVQENRLYFGGPELPLREQGVVAGVAYSATGEREGSMGVDLGDYDGDGRADLWYTNYVNQDNSLYRKVEGIGFLNTTAASGIGGKSRQWVGFGTCLTDFDSDGWPDLFVANGHVAYERNDGPYFQPAQLFRNTGESQFVEVTDQGGPYFSVPHAGRGTILGDLNDDGGLDLVVVHQNDPVAVLENRHPPRHWLKLRLQGRESNPDAVGAKVVLQLGERQLAQWVRGGGGYLSYFDPRIHFALPDERPVEVAVKWPTGATEFFSDLTPGKTHDLVEGLGRRP